MNVWYITMIFPATTETFACVDVRTLRTLGTKVSVHAMRSVRPRGADELKGLVRSRAKYRVASELLRERNLSDLVVTHSSAWAMLNGLWQVVRRPSIGGGLLAWLFRHNWRRPRHLLKSLALVPRSLDIFFMVKRKLPDVVHLFWGHYPVIVGYLVKRHLPNIVLSMFVGAYDLGRRYTGTAAVGRIADVVWTHAKENATAIEQLGVPRDRINVVYRGIDIQTFSDRNLTKVEQRILSAGRLSASKGMDDVLAAFSRVLSSWPHATLVLLGDGPERRRLSVLARTFGINHAVSFKGHVSHDQVREEMAAASVFLFMSKKRTERLPNAVKEAMASRCLCVVTDTPGIRELVEDSKSGFVITQGDITGAAERIDLVFRERPQSDEIASAARESVVNRFDVRHTMGMYRERWQELLTERRQSEPSHAAHAPARGRTPRTAAS